VELEASRPPPVKALIKIQRVSLVTNDKMIGHGALIVFSYAPTP
jgi:hypothetical protein